MKWEIIEALALLSHVWEPFYPYIFHLSYTLLKKKILILDIDYSLKTD